MDEYGLPGPDDWSADVAALVCERSAVIRLGGTLVTIDQELPVGAFDAVSGVRLPGAPGPAAAVPAVGAPAPPATFHPADWQLEAGVVVGPEAWRAVEADPAVAEAAKIDLAEALASGADRIFLQGAGPPAEPAGITVHVGAVAPGLDLLATARNVLAAVRPAPAAGVAGPPVFRNPGWIFSPDTLDLLTGVQLAGRPLDSYRLLELDGADGGVFLGFPFVLSAGAADVNGANNLYFATDWQDALVGVDPCLVSVEVSTEAPPAPPGRGFVIRASMPVDFALRRVRTFARA